MKFNTEVEEKPDGKDAFHPFPPGTYEYTIDEAEDAVSKNGNEMIHATLSIYNDAGHKRILHEYFVNTAAWKIKQLCESCGLIDRFNSGELEPYELVGKTGRANIVIESSVGFDDKNKVAAYIKAPRAAPTAPKGKVAMDDIDSIPF